MLIVFTVNIMVIATVVMIHYEFMYRFTLLMQFAAQAQKVTT